MDPILRDRLIFNRHLPFEVLRALTEDKYRWAQNYTTPVGVLEKLSMERYWIVRCSVAHNPNTPVWVLEKLMRDTDATVRYNAARHVAARQGT